MNTKRCGRCKEEKSVNDFYKNKQTKDGLKCWCKNCCKKDNQKREHCYNERRRQYRETHKDEVKANKRRYYRENKERILVQNTRWAQTPRGRFSTYKNQAKHRNIEFHLTEEEFNKYWRNPCHYCGSEIDTIGLDRIDSNGNYEKENVVPCCSICNKMKLDLSQKVFLEQIQKIFMTKRDLHL